MKNFIKELYFNNIDPQARYFEKNSYLQKQMSTLSECEQILTEKLTGDEFLLLSYNNIAKTA
ncbi:MAG: hypothetical protein IJJ15_05665 [Ruminococcus sp.]|nr:hypothetical protein [Ruminococcus sp.]MBQ6153214.1 hypothetical protein [Ruminococcus sp.]